MTTVELLARLTRECPNGVSFDPMAMRLLRHKVLFEDGQIEDLKAEMFQMGELWFSRGMISDDGTRFALEEQARRWLQEYGFFSVERLFEEFCTVLRHITSPELCAVLLQHLGFSVVGWKKGGYFCVLGQSTLDENLTSLASMIAGWLDKSDRPLTVNEVEQALPHLTVNVLESIRTYLLPEVHKIEVREVTCWCTAKSIHLPEDFSDKLTTSVDILISLGEKISVSKIEFALNLFYRARFRDEYSITDDETFMRVCSQHYQGTNNLFLNTKFNKEKSKNKDGSLKRIRSQNTEFSKLGVPIGAQLSFTKDSQITCIVQDGINKVQYEGKTWTISSLARHLLGLSAANGFAYFRFEGITLWERRTHLGREGTQSQWQTEERATKGEQKKSTEIMGSMGRSSSTSARHISQTDGDSLRGNTQEHRSENRKTNKFGYIDDAKPQLNEAVLKVMASKGLVQCKGTVAMYDRADEQSVVGVVARTLLKLCSCHSKGGSYRLHRLLDDCKPFAKVNRNTGAIDVPKAIRSAFAVLMHGTEAYYDSDGTLVKASDPVNFTIEKVKNVDQWIIHFNDY